MKKNMGSIDRILRVAAAAAVAVLYFSGVIYGATAVVLGFLALVFLATSIFGSCPLYIPLGISTRKKDRS
jgi:uncharacterized membrane protein